MQPWFRWFVAAVALALGLGIPSRAFSAPLGRDYTMAPAPSWVASAPAIASSLLDEGGGGLVDLLADDQLRVDQGPELYLHRIRRITSAAGIEQAGELELVVDPSYERLVLHGIHIVRGEQRIDAHKAANVRAFDSEQERDQRIYDGSRHVVFILSDLRVGDVVDFEVSFIGQNPVFGGRLTRWMDLASSRPTGCRRARVLTPTSRLLAVRLHNTDVPTSRRTIGSDTELVWEQRNIPAIKRDGDEPSYYDSAPGLVVTEFDSWASVAHWAAPLFESKSPPSAALNGKIREIRDAHPTAEARALAALRFVQDDIRYLGVELGEHSHRPHAASAVFEQRFGDCKDKVNLLLTILRSLGIEAHGAFVNTRAGGHIAEELPRPQVFDHVVAQLRIDGRAIWVDPTRSSERGPLGAVPLRYQRALVAALDTTDLAVVDDPRLAEPSIDVHESFRLKGDSAQLAVTSTYRGGDANDQRRTVNSVPRDKLKSRYLEFYTATFAGAEATLDLLIDDDERANVVTIREAYELPAATKQARVPLRAHALAGNALSPKVTHRSTPVAVEHPFFIRHTIDVESDGREVLCPASVVSNEAALLFTMQCERQSSGLRVVFELKSLADSVAVGDLQRHFAALATIRDAIHQDLPLSTGNATGDDGALYAAIFFGGILVIAIVAYALFNVRNILAASRRWRWLRRAKTSDGQVPAKPIRLRSRQEAERRVREGRWECGHKQSSTADTIQWSVTMFDGRKVSTARVDCTVCGERRVRYFVLSDEAVESLGGAMVGGTRRRRGRGGW